VSSPLSNNEPARTQPYNPHAAAHEDGLLMHELTVVNGMIGRYVLRYLDEDAQRADPPPPAEEHALADRLSAAADGIRTRAERRSQQEQP
jgi:hypothetical protein